MLVPTKPPTATQLGKKGRESVIMFCYEIVIFKTEKNNFWVRAKDGALEGISTETGLAMHELLGSKSGQGKHVLFKTQGKDFLLLGNSVWT